MKCLYCQIPYIVVSIFCSQRQGFVSGVALEFLPPVTNARLLIMINIKNQCLAMLVKPELKLGYAELPIATTSSRACTVHVVRCIFLSIFDCSRNRNTCLIIHFEHWSPHVFIIKHPRFHF